MNGISSVEVLLIGLVIALGVALLVLIPRHRKIDADIDGLRRRVQKLVDGNLRLPVNDRRFAGRLDELARTMEMVREVLLRQETSFEAHRAMMDQIVSAVGEGLIAVDTNGRVVYANERASTMFGNPDLLGKSLLEVVRKRTLVEAVDKALKGEASSERTSLELRGSERHIDVRVFPVEASGEAAAVVLFIDVTQVERLQRIRKDFLDDFSHEVRTPLAGLRSAAETFAHGPLTDAQEDQLRKVILRQLDRIERLVKDVAELNRIESGELVLERRNVDLRNVLRDLCDEFRQRIAGKPLTFTVRGDETVARVDPARAQQIFTNLLDNACRHGGGRGEILVEVGRENGEAVVRVSDEGEGIPEGEMERIFHRFYRVDKSRSQLPGVGLGLAIAKHLVLIHGGSIRAYNRPAGGATFEVRLPRR